MRFRDCLARFAAVLQRRCHANTNTPCALHALLSPWLPVLGIHFICDYETRQYANLVQEAVSSPVTTGLARVKMDTAPQ